MHRTQLGSRTIALASNYTSGMALTYLFVVASCGLAKSTAAQSPERAKTKSTETPAVVATDDWRRATGALIENSCLYCHDGDTETRLDFETLGRDLSAPDTFRSWVHVFERIESGEMPPPSEPRPAKGDVENALENLGGALRAANLEQQITKGRVPMRRLTRLEHANTLRDLLLIDFDFSDRLPTESDTGRFDTIGTNQGISPLHVRSYLSVASRAIKQAANYSARPALLDMKLDYLKSPYVRRWFTTPLQNGGNYIAEVDDGVAMYIDFDYLLRSDACGVQIRDAGRYKMTADIYALNAKTPVTFKLVKANEASGKVDLLGAVDLKPGESQQFELDVSLASGDYFYPSVQDIDLENFFETGAKGYAGEGIVIRNLHIQGPIIDQWPPISLTSLLPGVEIVERESKSLFSFLKQSTAAYQTKLTETPEIHTREIVSQFAKRAFRRPIEEAELNSYVELCETALKEGKDFEEAIVLPLQSILTSPRFLFFDSKPGKLDDFALAARLSYFLWRSMPDQALLDAASAGNLSDPEALSKQVERMLDDAKSQRFVDDFLGQWLKLDDIDLTSPDEHLYPEYDDLLARAIKDETKLFFAELLDEDLPARNLIDSDFTFANRRLAEHYGIEGVWGQELQKIELPSESVRGGVLAQASVLKTSANGTVTSPVTRGAFVLTNLLGQEPSPPPPNVGSIEPDTRGATTIRETLDKHRNTEACAVCHRKIDPPGFALESFDPIGGFRERYRTTSDRVANLQYPVAYGIGPVVDPSGELEGGPVFANFFEFKKILMSQEDQVAKHLIEELIVFGTGSEIQFADRDEVQRLVVELKPNEYRLRSIVHAIVQSRLFQHQ